MPNNVSSRLPLRHNPPPGPTRATRITRAAVSIATVSPCRKRISGQLIRLQIESIDDAVEAIVNGRSAGIRLWPPYEIDVTDKLQPGENTLELRVANTLINLLEAVERPSGLSGPPRLVPYQRPVGT